MHLRDEPVALTEAPEFAMLGPWLGRAETVTVVTFGEHMRRRVATPDEIAACRAAFGEGSRRDLADVRRDADGCVDSRKNEVQVDLSRAWRS